MTERSRGEIAALAELPFEAASDVVVCVEGVHQAIASRSFAATGPLGAPVRMVHDSVAAGAYVATRLLIGALGRGVSLVATAAAPSGARALSRSRGGNMLVAAVNGYAGDRLRSRGSELVIPMAVRADGRDVPTTAGELRRAATVRSVETVAGRYRGAHDVRA